MSLLLALLVAASFAGFERVFLEMHPLDGLDSPYSSAVRYFERELELSTFAAGPSLIARFFRPLSEVIGDTIEGYTELMHYLEKRPDRHFIILASTVTARLVILLGEAQRWDEAERLMRKLPRNESARSFMAAARYAYSGFGYHAPPDDSLDLSIVNAQWKDAARKDWCLERLQIRLAGRGLDRDETGVLERRLLERCQKLRVRILLMAAAYSGSVGSGLILLAAWIVRSRRIHPVSSAQIPPAWSILDGYHIMVRSAFFGITALYAAIYLSKYAAVFKGVYASGTLAASVPMMLYIRSRLLPRCSSVLETLGLKLAPGTLGRLASYTLVLTFVDQAGSSVIHALFSSAGSELHWAETIDEDLLFGSPVLTLLNAADSVFWAPIFEEIGCRGLLYGTLRKGFSPWISAAASAMIFGGVHFYSIPGFFEISWSGLVWALAYEKSRSLLPGMLSHGFNNLFVTLTMIVAYR